MDSDVLTICVVGCGRGERVARLRENGYDAYGIDVSPTTIAAAADRVAPFVYVADAEKRSDWVWVTSRTDIEAFDCIITERCLSQFEEPARTCRLLREFGHEVCHEVGATASVENPAQEPLTLDEWKERVDPDGLDEWHDAAISVDTALGLEGTTADSR